MTTAYCCLKKHADARHDVFMAGLRAAGYATEEGFPRCPVRPDDIMIMWNRKGEYERHADLFEGMGGKVLVAENGYIGKDANGHQHYALAIHGHNGSGLWYSNGPDRFRALGLELKPWRTDGRHILVCPNRFIAPKWFLMPSDWERTTVAALRRLTDRPIRVRPHPGHWKRLTEHPSIGLARDLENAWACVIWSSSAGLHALVNGIPVIRTGPFWVAAGADGTDLAAIENPPMPDRVPVFECIACAQWSLAEIASGLPFRVLRGEPLC
jgi:hypothetical protein